MDNQRVILTEWLELYRTLPCLWDITCEEYKDKYKRNKAWELMLEKYKLIEPEADITLTKKKIENMRIAYKRESKRVMISKQGGSMDIHIPNLWYYNLLCFLDKKDEYFDRKDECFANKVESFDRKVQNYDKKVPSIDKKVPSFEKKVETPTSNIFIRNGVETINKTEIGEGSQNIEHIKKRPRYEQALQRKKERLLDIAQELLTRENKSNSFGTYVGEQLDSVEKFQRQVAEKLISEVIFLAKTGNLNYDTKIHNPPRIPVNITTNNIVKQEPIYSRSNSPQSPDIPQSPIHDNIHSGSPHYNRHSNITPQQHCMYIVSPTDSTNVSDGIQGSENRSEPEKITIKTERPTSLLKEYLIKY